MSKTTSHAELETHENKFKSKRNSINIETSDINSYSREFSASKKHNFRDSPKSDKKSPYSKNCNSQL